MSCPYCKTECRIEPSGGFFVRHVCPTPACPFTQKTLPPRHTGTPPNCPVHKVPCAAIEGTDFYWDFWRCPECEFTVKRVRGQLERPA